MGGSTSKGRTFWGRKREEPAKSNTWNSLKGALSLQKHPKKKKGNKTLLDKLHLEPFKKEGPSQKRFSLVGDGKGSLSIKLSLKASKKSKPRRNLGRKKKKDKKKEEKKKEEKKKGGKGVFDSVLNYSPPRQRLSLVQVLT